ncbi:venom protease-like [Anopheles stephensi]|uniref:venom protease-like n=1 Tax=Anopheles stephensi TaxID=30069 RepID=UPI0016587F76|nr:venom protease-like [Anopheles stephensi]
MTGFVKSCLILALIVQKTFAQDGQPCYTSYGASGVCMSVGSCPAAYQLNINPFGFFGAAPRGCQNFLGFGSVCCSIAAGSNPALPNYPFQPSVISTTSTTVKTAERYPSTTPAPAYITRPRVGLECVRSDGTVGPCASEQPVPITSTTGRSTTIRSTTPVILQTRLRNSPSFETPAVLLTPEQGCGVSDVEHNRVVGGVPAALNGWPWMALVGYEEAFGDIEFRCGGSLITDRHVLSAAHCILPTLSVVRLGEHDMDNQTESAHVDVPVYKYISHPSYDTFDGHSDLAILYLSETVKFNTQIKPICLPTTDPVRSADFTGYNPFIAGWGRTKETGFEAKVLQELQIPILENEECSQLYKKIRKLFSQKQFNDAVLCAGRLEGGKDSCQGDSGGPLMLPYLVNRKFHYFQIGVVSYGVGCARAEIPGVYTRVAKFVDWIVEQISNA